MSTTVIRVDSYQSILATCGETGCKILIFAGSRRWKAGFGALSMSRHLQSFYDTGAISLESVQEALRRLANAKYLSVQNRYGFLIYTLTKEGQRVAQVLWLLAQDGAGAFAPYFPRLQQGGAPAIKLPPETSASRQDPFAVVAPLSVRQPRWGATPY